jgi:FMN phosphatase YigB (HAD superfamily)
VDELGLAQRDADRIGAEAGKWPLFADSADALRRLWKIARCAAITNSDLAHRPQIEAQLGFALDGWICAEQVRRYKPDPEMWHATARLMGVAAGRDWWHVSAYADYDHRMARSLGLSCAFVQRPHARSGPADLIVGDLAELAARLR